MKIEYSNTIETFIGKVPGDIRTLERDRNILSLWADWHGIRGGTGKLYGLLGVTDALNTVTVVRWPHGTLT